jgi:hypothetical protein
MGMLAARIRKQDQVNGDTVLVQPNEKGGAVRTAAIGNNIDMLTSYNNNYGLRRGSQPRLFPSQSRSC